MRKSDDFNQGMGDAIKIQQGYRVLLNSFCRILLDLDLLDPNCD